MKRHTVTMLEHAATIVHTPNDHSDCYAHLTELAKKLADGTKLYARPTPSTEQVEQLARLFHETYERLAPSFGYETRKETREFDAASPNGKLMIAVCAQILCTTLHIEPQSL